MSCIEFQGARNACGYGCLRMGGKVVRAHRLAYCQANGLQLADIAGVVVRHTCDNPACVNPAHLVPGTHTDNMRDMVARGRNRQPKGEKNGRAVLTEAAVRTIRSRLAAGESQRTVAAALGIDKAQVSRIKTGAIWRHVQ